MGLIKIFKGFDLMGKAITIVVIIGLAWIIKNRAGSIISKSFVNLKYKAVGASNTDGTNGNKISEERKMVLNELTNKLKEAIYSWFFTAESAIRNVNSLGDNEFVFVCEMYNDKHGNVMQHVDDELLPETDEDEKFILRYNKLGLPKP